MGARQLARAGDGVRASVGGVEVLDVFLLLGMLVIRK
jgi:hypothetical protein